jgi:hypothetical protein
VSPTSACGPEPTLPFQSPGLAYTNGQSCALEDTTIVAAAPCFASVRSALTVNVPLLGSIPLEDGQVIGTWQTGAISQGHVRGFLSKAVADTLILPPGTPNVLDIIKEGIPVSSSLNDLAGSAITKNARGEDGWWIQLSFEAQPATFDPALPAP